MTGQSLSFSYTIESTISLYGYTLARDSHRSAAVEPQSVPFSRPTTPPPPLWGLRSYPQHLPLYLPRLVRCEQPGGGGEVRRLGRPKGVTAAFNRRPPPPDVSASGDRSNLFGHIGSGCLLSVKESKGMYSILYHHGVILTHLISLVSSLMCLILFGITTH